MYVCVHAQYLHACMCVCPFKDVDVVNVIEILSSWSIMFVVHVVSKQVKPY